MERYAKQILFHGIGEEGQRKIQGAKVVIIGCGALGTVIANNLARSGVGYIRLVDRDYIELSNLQRQILFDEEDIANHLPKAVAAVEKLRKVNSTITLESLVTDVNARNIEKICRDMDLILDATDNFNIRYIINDASIQLNIPWIYGGAVGSIGMVHTIIPGQRPCLRCIFPEVPAAGAVETCDIAGVLNGTTNIVASLQSTEGLKVLTGQLDQLIPGIRYIDIWNNDIEIIDIRRKEDCPACQGRDFEFLRKEKEDAIYLCGKDSVQINPLNNEIVTERIIERLENIGIEVKQNAFYLRFMVEGIQFTLFYDGRAILKNISDISKAKSLYAKYIGL